MTVFVLERAAPSLRGELTRWLLEVRAGVFVGTVSRRVREKLWQMITKRRKDGAALCVFRAPNEQGFDFLSAGDASRSVIDLDGLKLVRVPWNLRNVPF